MSVPAGPVNSDSDRRYVAIASPLFPVASISPATATRLTPTSVVAAEPAPGSARSDSRASSTDAVRAQCVLLVPDLAG